MNVFKLIYLTLIQLGKQIWLLPGSLEKALQQRRQRFILKEREVERLDRILNPSKYQGK